MIFIQYVRSKTTPEITVAAAFRCPGVRLGAGCQVLDYAGDLAKFGQLTDDQGSNDQLDSNFNNLLSNFYYCLLKF